MSLWHRHPGVRSDDQLTFGEKAADAMRTGMGSWPFVFGAVFFLIAWMASKGLGLDQPPYILLNLLLSCLAALQGAILLIAAKRADQISSELAMHTYENTQADRQLLDENTELTKATKANTDQIVEVHRHVTAITEHLGITAGLFDPPLKAPPT